MVVLGRNRAEQRGIPNARSILGDRIRLQPCVRPDEVGTPAEKERDIESHPSRHPGQARIEHLQDDACAQQFIVEGAQPVASVSGVGGIGVNQHNVIAIETQIDVLQIAQRPDKSPGPPAAPRQSGLPRYQNLAEPNARSVDEEPLSLVVCARSTRVMRRRAPGRKEHSSAASARGERRPA